MKLQIISTAAFSVWMHCKPWPTGNQLYEPDVPFQKSPPIAGLSGVDFPYFCSSGSMNLQLLVGRGTREKSLLGFPLQW